MCERLNAESIAVPSGNRLACPAFSADRAGEGRAHTGEPMFFIVNARIVACDTVLAAAWPALPCA